MHADTDGAYSTLSRHNGGTGQDQSDWDLGGSRRRQENRIIDLISGGQARRTTRSSSVDPAMGQIHGHERRNAGLYIEGFQTTWWIDSIFRERFACVKT